MKWNFTFPGHKYSIQLKLKVVPMDLRVVNEQDQRPVMRKEREYWRGDEIFVQQSVWIRRYLSRYLSRSS